MTSPINTQLAPVLVDDRLRRTQPHRSRRRHTYSMPIFRAIAPPVEPDPFTTPAGDPPARDASPAHQAVATTGSGRSSTTPANPSTSFMYRLHAIPRRWLLSVVTVAYLLATIGTSQAAPLTRVHEVGKSNATQIHYIVVSNRHATDVSIERTVRKARDQGDAVHGQFVVYRPARAGRELRERAVVDRIPRLRAVIDRIPRLRAVIDRIPRRSCIRRLRPQWLGRPGPSSAGRACAENQRLGLVVAAQRVQRAL
jgi:hypothetical protein